MVIKISKANFLWVFANTHWRIVPIQGAPTYNKCLCQNPMSRELDRQNRHAPQASSQGERVSSPPPPT
jgi:hypothetical protein